MPAVRYRMPSAAVATASPTIPITTMRLTLLFWILIDDSLLLRHRTITNSGRRQKYMSDGLFRMRLLDSYSTERANGTNRRLSWETPF
jgi:hypothetical protein